MNILHPISGFEHSRQKPREKETTLDKIKRLTGIDIGLCPYCKKGKMHIVREIPRIRSPDKHLPTLLTLHLY